MAGITGFGSSRISPWKQFEAWRAVRADAAKSMMASNDNFTSLFAQAHASKIDGTAKLAMEAALKRVNAVAKAKFDTIANTKIAGIDDLPKVDKTI